MAPKWCLKKRLTDAQIVGFQQKFASLGLKYAKDNDEDSKGRIINLVQEKESQAVVLGILQQVMSHGSYVPNEVKIGYVL